MKYLYSILLLSIFAICFSGCEEEKQVKKEIDKAYSKDTLVKIASRDVDEAILYVIEGEMKGKLTSYQANYLCAQLTYQYTNNNLMAIKYCQNALLALDIEDNYEERVEILYLLSNVAYAALDLNTSITAALEGKEIAHKHKMDFEEAAFDYVVGRCRFNMGEIEGLEIMREAINRARHYAKERIEFGHLVFFVGDLTICYATLGHTQTNYMNDLLSELQIHEQLVNEMERRFPQAKSYCDRNRFQITLYRAVANAALGKLDVADNYFEQCLKSDLAYNQPEHLRQIEYYAEIGKVDSVISIYNRYPPEGDTIQRSFRREIGILEIAYRKVGDNVTADSYHKRYEELSKLIEQRELKEGLALNNLKYDSQNYKLILNDHEESMQRLFTMIFILIAIIFIFLLFVLVGLFIHRKR